MQRLVDETNMVLLELLASLEIHSFKLRSDHFWDLVWPDTVQHAAKQEGRIKRNSAGQIDVALQALRDVSLLHWVGGAMWFANAS